MFFEDGDNLLRTLVMGGLGYAGVVLLLRLSGNRTLSKLNSFDLVVTISFGSVLASLMVTKGVSLAQGLMAIAVLIGLQYGITWLSVRSDVVRRSIKTQPTLLLLDGQFLQPAMRRVRVTEDEIRGALRGRGIGSLDQAAAVVLDTDGSLSVISRAQRGNLDALQGVQGTQG